ncbi:NAD(P)-dependent oxidoreductase [Rhodococcus jostii]|uniref:Putative dehydrogenase n=1 Tax=Rhodococcus jostii TaxID=132919 RepID=A0A1H5LZT8_RHOJO|nr:NAD(P)-dependent oxidoreductase [Rhodococcus jostii]SEE82516.1 putative dehydrogenase [Rhodococcus jostii]
MIRDEPKQRLVAEGGIAAATNAEVGEGADVVFVMVVNDEHVRDVLFGENGLIETLRPGAAVILTATIGKQQAQDIAARLSGKGIHMIDSGVSGGLPGANAGTLTLMASGPKAVFDENLDVLRAVGDENGIFHVGEEIGAGQVVKACMQALVGVTFQGTFEALVLGAKAGVKAEVLLDVLGSSVVGSTLFKRTTSFVIDRDFVDTGSHIAVTWKDLGLTLDLAREAAVPMPSTALANQLFQTGKTMFPGEDNWAIVKVLEQMADTIVTSDKA